MKKIRAAKRVTCSQVMATVCVLGWATCPMAFAVERGKQEGKRVVREMVLRVVGAAPVNSLLGQLGDMDIGMFHTSDSNTATGQVYTLERPEGTYIFSQMAVTNNGISGNILVFDTAGQEVIDMTVSQIDYVNNNMFNFNVTSSPTADVPAVTVIGSMIGVQSVPGTAIVSASVNGSDQVLLTADFGSEAAQAVTAAGSASPVTFTSFPSLQQNQGGVASFWGGLAAVAVGIVGAFVGAMFGAVIVGTLVAAGFVAVTCLAFGWFCGM